MKAVLTILFITLITFSGSLHSTLKSQYPATTKTVAVQNLYNDSLKQNNDDKKLKYLIEVKKTEILTNQLITKTENLELRNSRLIAEIKSLRKLNDFLLKNVDTIYIHDTVFKRRKILQLFRN